MPHTNVGPSIQRYLCFKYTALLQVLIGHYASSFNRFFFVFWHCGWSWRAE